MARMAFNDESIGRFRSLTEQLVEDVNSKVLPLHASLSEQFSSTHYAKIGELANGIISAYNECFCLQLLPQLTEKWDESEASLQHLARIYGAGESAVDNASKECQAMIGTINDGIKMLDELNTVTTDTPDMSKAETVFSSLIDSAGHLVQEIEGSQEAYKNAIDKLREENTFVMALLPVASLFSTITGVFGNFVGKQVASARDDYNARLNRNQAAIEDDLDKLEHSSLGGEKKSAGAAAAAGAGPKASGGGAALNPKFKNKLRLFAHKLLTCRSGNISVFKELTQWLYSDALAPVKKERLPFNITAALMDIYETFFKKMSCVLLPERIDASTVTGTYKPIISAESRQFLEKDDEYTVFLSHPDNPYSYYIVSRMVRYLCTAPEPPKGNERNETDPQPAKWGKWPDDVLIYRTFFVISDLAGKMEVKPDNPEAPIACDGFNDYAARTIYSILGEAVPVKDNKSRSTVFGENGEDSPEEIPDLEKRIAQLEAYLKEQGEEIKRLHRRHGDELRALLEQSRVSHEALKNEPQTREETKAEKQGKPSSDRLFDVPKSLINDIGGYVRHIGLIRTTINEGFNDTQKKGEGATKLAGKVQTAISEGLQDSESAVYGFVQLISGFMNIAKTFVVPLKRIAGVVMSVGGDGFSEKIYSSITGNAKISKMLSPQIWKTLKMYCSSEDKAYIEEVVRFYQHKAKNKKVSRMTVSQELDLLYTGTDTFEENYGIPPEKAHASILAADYYMRKKIKADKISNMIINNSVYFSLVYSAMRYDQIEADKAENLVRAIDHVCSSERGCDPVNYQLNVRKYIIA